MSLPISQWPTWYTLLIAYTAIVGLRGLHHQRTIAHVLKAQERLTDDPHQRGKLVGYRMAGWAQSIGWLVAAGLLVTGRSWAIMVVAIAYAFSARQSYSQFARGVAEGFKSVELASAPEYVHGRIVPRARDHAVAIVYVSVTRLLPLGATLVALTWVGR